MVIGSQGTSGQFVGSELKEMDFDDIKKLLDWITARELTWIVLGATCFIGLIELTPEIKHHGSSINGKGLTVLVILVTFVLIGGCVFSIDRYIRLVNSEGELEKELPESMRKQLWGTMGPAHNIFFEIDKDGNFLRVRNWVAPVVSSIFAIIFYLIVIFKIMPFSKKPRDYVEEFDGDY